MRIATGIAVALVFIALPSPAVTRARYAMGTVCEITADDERQIASAFAEAQRIERLLSTWTGESELARLNRGATARVSPELYDLLRSAMRWSERTGGTFSPLVAPLVDLWKTRYEGALPKQSEVARALEQMHLGNVSFSKDDTIVLHNGAAFEEGGFGKGYAIDRMLSLISAPKVIVNFGGQLAVRGSFLVTIADPARRDVPVISLRLRDASLSTSSGSEKTFEVAGRHFSHILDPRSGHALPPRGSASVIARDALTADILSTALYVMGVDEGLRWAEANGVAVLFITTDHSIRISRAFRDLAREVVVLDRQFELQES